MYFFQLPFQVLGAVGDSFLLQQFGPGLVFRLRLVEHSVLVVVQLVLHELLVLLQLIVEDHIVLELVLILEKQRVPDHVGEGESLLAVHHENLPEEVLQVRAQVLNFLLLGERRPQVE